MQPVLLLPKGKSFLGRTQQTDYKHPNEESLKIALAAAKGQFLKVCAIEVLLLISTVKLTKVLQAQKLNN